MMAGRSTLPILLVALVACHRHHPAAGPAPIVGSTPRAIDSLWGVAEGAFNRGRWIAAQRTLDLLGPRLTPADPRYLKLHFMQGEILFAGGNQLQAVREFRRVADEQPDNPLAPEALMRAGDAYADLWRLPDLDPTYGQTAQTVYQEVVSRYGATPAAGRAGMRLAALSDKFAEKEYKNALFYFRFKAYDSAILLLRGVIATYPRAPVVSGALERLVRAYQILGYQEDVKETCAYIAQYHPEPAGPARFCRKAGPTTPGTGAGARP